MDIKEVIKASKDLGEWAYIATVSGSGTPYVTPVHPCWEGETLWIMVGVNSVKSKNIACLLYTSPSPRDLSTSRMPSSA